MRPGRRRDDPARADRGTKGAVFVEFLIVFLPMFCFFLSLVQFMFVWTANIVVKHATMTATRAAIVVLPDDPSRYGGVAVNTFAGARKSEIEKAALGILKSLDGKAGDLDIQLNGKYGRDEMVKLKLQFDFTCRIPFGRAIVCNFIQSKWAGHVGGGIRDSSMVGVTKKKLTAEVALPNQGADYTY